jgi:peptidoglycan/LPS O-acetylase OafA/YrhL/lysophospholipase L1-like esterase
MERRGLRYMPALDGMRAFAVVAVLLYHGGVSWARGGYFGVDAFFVISGFLITSLLLAEWRENSGINFKQFWARRARRLLPALALVLVVVAIYAARAAQPIELHQLRRDSYATIAYVANWSQIFSHQSYFEQFAAPSALKHTWSLAIEEQFYLLWPLIVFAALRVARGSKRILLAGCAVLAVASAVEMAVLYHPGQDPSRVYYGTDTRAQSLLIGAILAILLTRRPEIRSYAARRTLHIGASAAVVTLAVIWSQTSEGNAWQYRGGFALAAVLVGVVIAGVTQPSDPGRLGRFFALPPLRAIGIISYGLYLWHWPLYVFLSPDRTGLSGISLLTVRLVATFAVAIASYYLVEKPIRHGAIPSRVLRPALPVAAASLAVVVMASTAGAVPATFQSVSASQLKAPPTSPTKTTKKHPLRVMLVGDSVANSLAPGLAVTAKARGYEFWNASIPGCGLGTDVGDRWFDEWRGVYPPCLPGWRDRWPGEVKAYHPDLVVGLFGAQDAFDRRINGQVVKFDTPGGAKLAQSDLEGAMSLLSSRGAHVVLLTTPYYVLGWPQKVQVERSPLFAPWVNRYNDIERSVAQEQSKRVSVVDLNHFLDPAGHWTDTVDGVKVRTFDRCHLSLQGAAFVAKWLTPKLADIAAAATISRPALLRQQ